MTNPVPKKGPRHNWFFTSFIPLVRLGNQIRHDSLWDLLESHEADYQYQSFKRNWENEMYKERPSIFKALWYTYYPTLIYAIIVQTLGATLQFGLPVITPWVLDFLKNPSVEWYWGYVYGAIILVVSWASSVFWYKGMWLGTCVGMKIRSACMTLIYEKIYFVADINKGKFINLFASDAATIFFYMPYVMPAVVTPVTVLITVVLLSQQLGWVCVIALIILVIMLPCALYMGHRIGILRYDMQKYADQRLKITNEMIQGIRIVKYYSWESAFMEKIRVARESELQKMRRITILRTLITFIPNVTPTLCMAIMFCVYGYIGDKLTSSIAYTALSLMNMLRLPLSYFSSSGVLLFSISAAFDRMSNALVQPNRIPYVEIKKDIGISILDGEFKWSSSETPTLKKINLKVEQGDHVMITGTVGSGKTSLIMALMGEIPRLKGTVLSNGSIAYVPQQAWIYNATVRDNILFGKEFDKKRYKEVTEAAGLVADFAQFADGDNTEIGERGTNLSGGQKQRISIARALYSDRDIYILDDPFSALDPHVAIHVFNNAINVLLVDKTVILATNQLHFTREASHVVLIRKGKIYDQGSFEELATSSKLFSKLLATAGAKKEKKAVKEEKKVLLEEEKEPEVEDPEEEKKGGGLIQIEERQAGLIPFKIYAYWIKCGGVGWFSIVVLVCAGFCSISVLSSWWLSRWTTDLLSRSPLYSDSYWIWTYFGWLMSQNVLYGIALYLGLCVFAVKASHGLHSKMMAAIGHAVTAFFDMTPIGRMLSRLSVDLGLIDYLLPVLYMNFTLTLWQILAALITLSFGLWPLITLVVPLLIASYFLQRYFRRTNIEIQRMEAVSSSPPLSHMSVSLDGLDSIRSYGAKDRFMQMLGDKINYNNVEKFALKYGLYWIQIALEFVSGTFVSCVLFGIAIARNYFGINPNTGGIAVAFISGLPQLISWTAMLFTEIEIRMNNVERFWEFNKTAQEDLTCKLEEPPQKWPTEGGIRFVNFSFKYRKGGVVLRELNLEIPPRSKVGVVGRTGSGKSSLFQALFRMEEPHSGQILIDGVDHSQMSLIALRKGIAIIPQDPTLFIGTLRYNLDPFSEYQEEKIWGALEHIQLRNYISSLPGKLDTAVEEGGSNFSLGQRQLLCMARAIMRGCPILLLDEATASVDVETDQIIQKTVRTVFKEQTVLTIAHRVNTIMDSNLVLVLDQGRIAEFDSPELLLKNSEGIFTSMVIASGLKHQVDKVSKKKKHKKGAKKGAKKGKQKEEELSLASDLLVL